MEGRREEEAETITTFLDLDSKKKQEGKQM
jgi:hypothetical protein